MKIISLAFKNINSLKGEHHIDFTDKRFRQNPLFAITGPTGSGKTTLLDVISLALFDRVPRLGKISKNDIEEKGAILTRNQKEAYAQVTYVSGKGNNKTTYTSIWRIHTSSRGNLQDYDMELSRMAPFETLDLKKSEVPGKNEELIGLSYAQFIKAVVLAQGEFAKFLKADKKERSRLLEKITGTSIYRELGMRAFRRYADENKTIAQEIGILEAEKEKLLSADKRKALQDTQQQIAVELATSQKKYEDAKAQLTIQKEIDDLAAVIAKNQEDLKRHQDEQNAFQKTHGKRLVNHETVLGFTTELHTWKHTQQTVEELKKEAAALRETDNKFGNQQNTLFRKIETFVGHAVNRQAVEKELQEFYEKVNELQQVQKELQQESLVQRDKFKREMEEVSLEYSLKELVKNEALWQQVLTENATEKQHLAEQFGQAIPENIEAAIKQNEQAFQLMNKARGDYQMIAQTSAISNKYAAQLDELNEVLHSLPDNIKEARFAVKAQELTLKELRLAQEEYRMQAKYAEDRRRLQDGKPCPLCGAVAHPYAVNHPEIKSGLEEKIHKAEEKVDRLKTQLAKLEAKKEEVDHQIKEVKNYQEQKQHEVKQLQEQFSVNYDGKYNWPSEAWPTKIEEAEEHLDLLKHYARFHQKTKALEKAQPIYNAIKKVVQQWQKKALVVKKLYSGDNLQREVSRFKKAWRDLTQNRKAAQEQQENILTKLHKKAEALNKMSEDLLPALQSKGFKTVAKAEEALMPTEEYNALTQKSKRIEDDIKNLNTTIKTQQEQQSRYQSRLEGEQNVATLKQTKARWEKAIQEQQQKYNETQRLLQNDKERQQEISKKEESIKGMRDKNRRWELLNRLIGDSTGNKFNQFAQGLTLRHLVHLANQHLKTISERYRLAIDKTVNIDDTRKDNLVIADLDMGGQERAVQTLSGGETFLISLSLALALSDLASEKINIDSLFIDEGFGTLDPETLDQTLDTLERLQASSAKTIGIISHVEALKERINTQIQLQQNGQGYSSLKIMTL